MYWLFLCRVLHRNVHLVPVVILLIPLEVHELSNVCNTIFVSKIGVRQETKIICVEESLKFLEKIEFGKIFYFLICFLKK